MIILTAQDKTFLRRKIISQYITWHIINTTELEKYLKADRAFFSKDEEEVETTEAIFVYKKIYSDDKSLEEMMTELEEWNDKTIKEQEEKLPKNIRGFIVLVILLAASLLIPMAVKAKIVMAIVFGATLILGLTLISVYKNDIVEAKKTIQWERIIEGEGDEETI